MKVLFTESYSDDKMQRIKDLGYDVFYKHRDTVENCDEVNCIDAIVISYEGFSRLDIDKMYNLKFIQTTSVGVDLLPTNKIIKKNIIVSNNRGGYSIPIGEWIVKTILDIYKNTIHFYKRQLDKQWKLDTSVMELSDLKIGFLGTGTISQEASKRLKPFGVSLFGVNTNGRHIEIFDKCFSRNNMDEVFSNCDVVVSVMPSTEDTIGLINKEKFDLMKKGSSFINVGRGDVINQEDLISCIKKFRGVGLDVFEKEPLNIKSKLWNFENVIITPHNSWWSNKIGERNFELVYRNLKNLKEGSSIENVVNLKRGY